MTAGMLTPRRRSAVPGPSRTAAAGIGLGGGLVGGLFGGGSGVFFVPALARATALSRPAVHGTAGAANIAVTGIGAATFAVAGGAVDLRAGTGMVIGATIGALFGARLIVRMRPLLLRTLFLAILLVTAVKLLGEAAGVSLLGGSAMVPAGVAHDLRFAVPVSLVAGVVIGAWSAGMGLGGGFMAVPVLMMIFGTDLITAEATSLLMFFPNAIVGTAAHLRQGTADARLALLLNAGAGPGALLGVIAALWVDVRVLGIGFAAFALAVAAREAVGMYTDVRADRAPGRRHLHADDPTTEDRSMDGLNRMSLSQQAAQVLLDQIVAGRWAVGDRLPGEVTLAEEFGVSRSTVREAIRHLAARGMLASRQGVGVFVLAASPTDDWERLARVGAISEVMQVRIAIETRAAALAATGHTPQDAAAIDQALAVRNSLVGDADAGELAAADIALHRAVVAASGNGLLLALFDSIRPRLVAAMTELLELVPVGDADADHHSRIVAAVLAGDAASAETCTRAHLTGLAAELEQA